MLSVRYPYLYKHSGLWDLIARQYKALDEGLRAHLDETFGAYSEFMTANYGHIMRWISKRMSSLRPQVVVRSNAEKRLRYNYKAAPDPLVVIDGVESKNTQIEVPWHAIPFDREMRSWGYDPSRVAFADPKTNAVVDLLHLRDVAYENTFSGNYDRVVIAIKRAAIVSVYINGAYRGNFWGTNTTVGRIKELAGMQRCDFVIGNILCDDCTTLYSLSRGHNFVSFEAFEMRPTIYLREYTNGLCYPSTELFGHVIDYIERMCPGTKVILADSCCQPPRDMVVKDVVKLFGDWRNGTLTLTTTSKYVHVVLYPEEHIKMNCCKPLVDTYADGEVFLPDLLLRFAHKIPSIREACKRIEGKAGTLGWENTFINDYNNPELLTERLVETTSYLNKECGCPYREIELHITAKKPYVIGRKDK